MSVVYIIGNREFGWYKIGCSSNLEKRFRELQAAVPFTLTQIASWACSYPPTLERWLHTYFDAKRLRGEWFALSEEDLIRSQKVVEEFFR